MTAVLSNVHAKKTHMQNISVPPAVAPGKQVVDEILRPTTDRYIVSGKKKYPDLWDMYKTAVKSIWYAEEIHCDDDLTDWREKMTENERYYIKHILAFFASADGIVNENLAQRFSNDVQSNEARAFYYFQMFMEEIHGETYGKLIDTYIDDSHEREMLFDSINTIPCVKEKAEWAIKWIENPQASFGERLLAFACVEGIFFSGSFAAIFWLRKRNLMPGLTQANSLISRDEGLHQRFACKLYKNYLIHGKPSKERAEQIVGEACEIEKRFQTEALPVSLIGMNNRLMKQYIEYVADYLLLMIGQDKIYNSANPFDFMDLIGMPSNTNQFEKKSTQYIRPLSKKEIDLDDDNF